MPGISGVNRNDTSSSLQSIDLNDDNNKNINKETSDNYKKVANMTNFEGVKAETTGHKAGRIIAGILGGLLLAAGIAAAAVAVTATLGVAVGVLGTVAAFAGITGSSIAAGAAGAAGIGLITTSALLTPKHPDEPAVQKEVEEIIVVPENKGSAKEINKSLLDENKLFVFKKAVPFLVKVEKKEANIDNEPKIDFKANIDNEANIAKELDSIKVDPENDFTIKIDLLNTFCQATYFQCEGKDSDIKIGQYAKKESDQATAESCYIVFTKSVLKKVGITDFNLSKKNVLLVRQAISQCVKTAIKGDAYLPYLPAYGSEDFQKDLLKNIQNNLKNYKSDEDKAALKIYVAAMTAGDLDELSYDNANNPDDAVNLIQA